MGARKFDRVKKIMWICVVCVTVTGALMGWAGLFFADKLLSLYSADAEVIAFGHKRLLYILTLYFLCGVMDVLVGSIRGMGYSIMPMIVSLIGACGLRVVWIFTIFQWFRSLEVLYISYPVTWTVTLLVHFVCFVWGIRKIKQKFEDEKVIGQKDELFMRELKNSVK